MVAWAWSAVNPGRSFCWVWEMDIQGSFPLALYSVFLPVLGRSPMVVLCRPSFPCHSSLRLQMLHGRRATYCSSSAVSRSCRTRSNEDYPKARSELHSTMTERRLEAIIYSTCKRSGIAGGKRGIAPRRISLSLSLSLTTSFTTPVA